MHSSIRWGLAGASLVLLAVGCTVASSDHEGAAEKSESAATVSEACGTGSGGPVSSSGFNTPAFRFYLVSHDKSGYTASELGSSYSACVDGTVRSQCRVDQVDLALLDMIDADATAVLDQIVTDPTAATLVFVGALTRLPSIRGVVTSLQVKEVWRAPALGVVHASDAWYHVSHDPMQALQVNRWSKSNVSKLDLAAAPWFSDCDPDDAGVVQCAPSQDGVLEDAATEAGILVDGTLSHNGTLRVAQYFAKITVGALHETNGYWYCHPAQRQCSTGFCSSTDNCVGLHFHGPVLKQIYTRSQAQEVQPWLIQTTQLTAAESADLVSRQQP